jgi:GDP-D-mannose 3',5'-epimerase
MPVKVFISSSQYMTSNNQIIFDVDGGKSMRRILVTGGGGFIGSHLARKLHRQGDFVRVADTKFDDYIREKYYGEKSELDLRDYGSCLAATKGMHIVYNLAANMGGIGFITAVGADVMRDNVLINANMLEACRKNKIERYFFSSSACIYPTYRQTDPKVKGLKEEDAYPAEPDNFYGWEKLYSEKMCEAYQRDYGMSIRVARYHNIYGPEGTYKGGREKSPAALCRKVALASDPGAITIWGDGKQTRSYCYIDDAVAGTIALMKSNSDRPVNIGSERLVTIDQLADIIIKISRKRIAKTYDPSAPQGVRGRNADIKLARSILGWEPKITLEEGLMRTYKWIETKCKQEQETCEAEV